MPVVSQAQRRFMYATEEGKTDAPKSVGRDFINASHGLKGLPEKVHPATALRSRLANVKPKK